MQNRNSKVENGTSASLEQNGVLSAALSVNEGNKLIAEFMGSDYTKRKIPDWAFKLYDFDKLKYGGYKYHSSWDWLMPVIIFAKSIKRPSGGLHTHDIFISRINDGLVKVNIEKLWIAVVEFIKWYNKNATMSVGSR